MNLTPKPGCPPDEIIALLALGSQGAIPESECEAWLAHVSRCERCADLVRIALRDLNQEMTEREAMLAAMIRPPQRNASRRKILWLLAVAAGVAVVGLFHFLSYQSGQSEDIPLLLAQAYTDTRPFEWRLPDAGYSPVRVQRGNGGSESMELRSAQVLVDQSAGQTAVDRKLRAWLQLLRSENPASAIAVLEQVVRELPNDIEAGNLLGVAFAHRGELTQSNSDFETAIMCWDRLMSLKPTDSSLIRFNRALAQVRLKRYAAAAFELEN